jgi:multidrug efflux pump
MARIWIFFVEKQALSYLLLIALAILGGFSMLAIQRESSPEVQIPIAIVSATLPGASPEDVELLLVKEIENAVANIDQVKKITSTAREGVGSVVVEFQASANLASSIQKVKDEVDRVRASLPEDATDPVVSEVNFADQPIVIASIVSDLPVTEFRKEAKDLAESIENVAGVSRAEVTGIREQEVSVLVQKEALIQHGLSLDDVTRAIRVNDVSAPVGSITMEGITYPLAFEGRILDTGSVAGIPLTTQNGATLRLSDVAYVTDGIEKPSTMSRVSVDGSLPLQAATLSVYKQRGADITQISRDVSTILEARNGGTAGTSVVVTFDAGENIITDLSQLVRTGLQTILLVLIVLFVALGWREALIASLSIPLSFLTALMVMDLTGNTLNFISLFSLILAIGILVDTAIVIVEAIHTNIKAGLPKEDAVRRAVHDFHYPVTTGNLTTIAVFAPLFTISGVTGEFIASIPFTVIAVLVSSLVISLAFIPLIASTFLHRESTHSEETQDNTAKKIQNWYRDLMPKLLDYKRRKWALVSGLTALLVILIALPFFGLIKVGFFPQSDVDYLYISIEEPQGTPLERTDLAVRTIEEAIMDVPEIEFFTTTIGAGSVFDQNPTSGPRFGSITLNLREERTRSSTEILKDIESRLAQYANITYRVLQPSEGPPSGTPVSITFYGEDTDDLQALTLTARNILQEVPGTRVVTSSIEDGAHELRLRIDRTKSAELGVTPSQVASTLRTAVFGTTATTIKTEGEEIDVVVQLNLNSNSTNPAFSTYTTLDALSELPLTTQSGTVVLLGSVIETSLSTANDTISREDRKRIATVSSQVADGYVAREVSTAFKTAFESEVTMPDGITMKLGGETEEVDQSFSDTFRALGLGVLLIFVVLVIQFNQFRQAFIVLSVVPLSLIGVLLGLLITREYLSFPSMLGFIALAGIVVNNAIILVDVWNRMRKDQPDMPLRDVVIEGATLRLRPILLTTITTIVGIAPLIFASELWRPIAVAIMFGLLFAVVLTLLLVPVLYLKLCKSKKDVNSLPDYPRSQTSTKETLEHIGHVMSTHPIKQLIPVLLLAVLCVPTHSLAFTYDTETIHTTYREAPAEFSVDASGNATGATVSGMPFRQYGIANGYGIRLQKFEIGLAYWYVSDRGVIWANSDLEALSVYLSRIA